VEEAPERLDAMLDGVGADAQRTADREWTVRLPSATRGAITCGLRCGERTLTLHAFFVRAPDRDREAVYRRALRKNLETYHWRFSLDEAGDLFMVAQVPLAGLDVGALGELLGALCVHVDETFEGMVRTGFDVPEGTRFGPPPGAG